MLLKVLFFVGLLGVLSFSPVWAQTGADSLAVASTAAADSGQQHSSAAMAADPAADDFTPMLGAIALLAVAVALVGVGVGIVLAAFVLAVAAVLFGIGITTSAVVVGLWRRSWAAGLRALLWLLATGGGVVIGAAFSVGVNAIVGITYTRDALALGSICGLLAGGVAAYTWLRLIELAVAIWQRRLSAAVAIV